jgi:hypothetical protein
MSDEREFKLGRNADETPAEEEVKLHVKGGNNMDDAPGAQDEDDDVEAHIKQGKL